MIKRHSIWIVKILNKVILGRFDKTLLSGTDILY